MVRLIKYNKSIVFVFCIAITIIIGTSCSKVELEKALDHPEEAITPKAVVEPPSKQSPASPLHTTKLSPKIPPSMYPTQLPGSGGPRQHSRCGNQKIEPSEQCDDGNTKNNDGCSKACRFEANFPLCRWQCSDPICPLLCDPVCEPPRCQTSCEEIQNPVNCSCVVKCEKPSCEIHCPDGGCESDSCPQCSTECQTPHCVTQCEQINPQGPACIAPPPDCTALCDPTNCDWKCTTPNCPKPICQLQCEQVVTEGC